MSIRHTVLPAVLAAGLAAASADASLVDPVTKALYAPALAPAESADAEQASSTAPDCSSHELAQEFLSVHDRSWYTLAHGGGFEGSLGAEHAFAGGAGLVAEQNPYRAGTTSVRIPAGGSVTTLATCVTQGYPYMRFFARAAGAAAKLDVEILYADGSSKPMGSVNAGPAWEATRRLSLAQGQFNTQDGETTTARFRFTVRGGAALVDDVYIDPFMKR